MVSLAATSHGASTTTVPESGTAHQSAQHRAPQTEGMAVASSNSSISEKATAPMTRWSMGILNDKETEEVPGTVLMLSSNRNEPLGIQHQHEQHSSSSMPAQPFEPRRPPAAGKKKTPDGQIILDPQPEDSLNDPLNWPAWRRDCALLSLGFYCMVGGGMTPILAAGFNNVADAFHVSYSRVALTTGLYMMGLGVGSVVFSPTAILFGKRPVYLVSAVMFILTSIWCALAPNYANLATARVFQGISVSPVECLPSATIAEIYFLHERAFRVGIYTLLLLGGKNLAPLVSAAIIQVKGWRWVFWVVAIIVGFGWCLLFLFVPETFWDRTPRPKSRRPTVHRSLSSLIHRPQHPVGRDTEPELPPTDDAALEKMMTPRQLKLHEQNVHARFDGASPDGATNDHNAATSPDPAVPSPPAFSNASNSIESHFDTDLALPRSHWPHHSPSAVPLEENSDDFGPHASPSVPSSVREAASEEASKIDEAILPYKEKLEHDLERAAAEDPLPSPKVVRYTTNLRQAPPKTYVQTLKPWNGRLSRSNWFLVALRPFILFAYPSVLWSTMVYSLSVGWLIVLSESVSDIYRNRDSYNFSALGTGLVYLSPFIGGILGTGVAGKVSDIIVRFMARRNGGIYEPEFRLVMALPVAISTAIGLMGFGWSAQERDRWIVPTIFFGIISFGCALGSTTAITFCVDSYRQFAGEALVTLNFSKNIFHGLVFSLFFAQWLESDGPKNVFVTIGGIQIACLLASIPMYIFGKRGRMWTVRKGFMEKF